MNPIIPAFDEIKKIVGGTWLELDGEPDQDILSISTRDHGDVGGEQPGWQDV